MVAAVGCSALPGQSTSSAVAKGALTKLLGIIEILDHQEDEEEAAAEEEGSRIFITHPRESMGQSGCIKEQIFSSLL